MYNELIRSAVRVNMRGKAAEQELSAASNGVDVEVKSSVYINDGAKTWPTVLASMLCITPSLSSSTRQGLADLLTQELKLSKPFDASRLSKALTTKAKMLTDRILIEQGYDTSLATSGIGIRDAVAAGKMQTTGRDSVISTRFEADGVCLGTKWYPYERVATYETEMPWYYLGLRIAGVPVALKTVLAMRDIGIGEFQNYDSAALLAATTDRLSNRKRLDIATAG
jgi:hypothetical protein